jgi:hypothetical protein
MLHRVAVRQTGSSRILLVVMRNAQWVSSSRPSDYPQGKVWLIASRTRSTGCRLRVSGCARR